MELSLWLMVKEYIKTESDRDRKWAQAEKTKEGEKKLGTKNEKKNTCKIVWRRNGQRETHL